MSSIYESPQDYKFLVQVLMTRLVDMYDREYLVLQNYGLNDVKGVCLGKNHVVCRVLSTSILPTQVTCRLS